VGQHFQKAVQFFTHVVGTVDGARDLGLDQIAKAFTQSVNRHLHSTRVHCVVTNKPGDEGDVGLECVEVILRAQAPSGNES
jgi:hypothetical protein